MAAVSRNSEEVVLAGGTIFSQALTKVVFTGLKFLQWLTPDHVYIYTHIGLTLACVLDIGAAYS